MQFASRPLLEMWFGCNSAAIPISDCGQTADLPPPQRVYLRLGMISYLSTPLPSPVSPFQRIIQITFASLPATCASSFPHLLIYPSVYHNSAHIWNVVWAPFGYPGTFLNTPKDTGSVSFTPGIFWAPFWTLFCRIQGSSGGNFGANLGSQRPNLGDGCAPTRQCYAAELSFRMTFWKTVMIFIGRRVLAAGGSSSVGSKLILHAKSWGGGGSSSVGSKLI